MPVVVSTRSRSQTPPNISNGEVREAAFISGGPAHSPRIRSVSTEFNGSMSVREVEPVDRLLVFGRKARQLIQVIKGPDADALLKITIED